MRPSLSSRELVRADTVIVTDTQHIGPDGMRELTWQLVGVDIGLMVSPNVVDIAAPRMYLGSVGSEPFIRLSQSKYEEAGSALKGFFDASLGTVLAILAAPVLLLAAIAIELTRCGPVFFLQERVGRDGRRFKMIEPRTKVAGAASQHEELPRQTGQARLGLFKLPNDPRITPMGRLSRRFSPDELPQLINLVKGDMSLVGPHPPRPEEVSRYDQREMRRLTVCPGITGIWQLSDLIILQRTIYAVVMSRGAY